MDIYVACCLGPICNLPSWVQGILPSLLGSLSLGRTYIGTWLEAGLQDAWNHAETGDDAFKYSFAVHCQKWLVLES